MSEVRKDMAPGYSWQILGCAPHEVAEYAAREEERVRRLREAERKAAA